MQLGVCDKCLGNLLFIHIVPDIFSKHRSYVSLTEVGMYSKTGAKKDYLLPSN